MDCKKIFESDGPSCEKTKHNRTGNYSFGVPIANDFDGYGNPEAAKF